jgi:uncharacterized protein (TIGR03118 family)
MKTTLIATPSPSRASMEMAPAHPRNSTRAIAFALGLEAFCLLALPGQAQNAFNQQNLVSDVPGFAGVTDTNLVNPWGLSFSATGPFWVADNRTGLSTVYNSTGAVEALVVTIPPPTGQPGPATPTGTIANSVAGFLGTSNATAHFLFCTEDGTISAWSGGSVAVLKVDYSASNAVFKGLAAGASGGNNYIYAADFDNAQVDVFDTNYAQVTLAGSFSDTNLPAGYAPFGIQNINGQIFVAYALQAADKHHDLAGPGHGYVDVFDTGGNLVKTFAAQGSLNSPWGLAVAPPGFGPFAGDILIGNFGDGRINAFDPNSGEWLAALNDATGVPFAASGLWAIAFGNGHNGGSTQALYFTAGINGQNHGLFGSLAPVYPSATAGVSYLQSNLVSDVPGFAAVTDTNLVNPWGLSFSATSPFWIADNRSGLSTVYNSTGAIQARVVTIPPPTGQPGPATPTGTIANSVAGFLGNSNTTAHFLFCTEDGTISAWSSGSAAVLEVDYSASNAVFKGLAAGASGGNNYIYATDFHNAQVDVFDTNYAQVTLAGSFSDTNIPAGYAPFGIQNINGQIFVAYALQAADKHHDVAGLGHGYVDVFDTSGNLLQRLISQSVLNSPWGLALAPLGFGVYGGNLLVGNFGDGHINVFSPATGAWLGALINAADGGPIEASGLWAIAFGNGHSGGDAHTLYFTAGINAENHGLFGSIAPITPTFTGITNSEAGITLNWAGGGAGPFVVQESPDLSGTNWVNVATTTNLNVTIAGTNQAGFFRLLGQGE